MSTIKLKKPPITVIRGVPFSAQESYRFQLSMPNGTERVLVVAGIPEGTCIPAVGQAIAKVLGGSYYTHVTSYLERREVDV